MRTRERYWSPIEPRCRGCPTGIRRAKGYLLLSSVTQGSLHTDKPDTPPPCLPDRADGAQLVQSLLRASQLVPTSIFPSIDTCGEPVHCAQCPKDLSQTHRRPCAVHFVVNQPTVSTCVAYMGVAHTWALRIHGRCAYMGVAHTWVCAYMGIARGQVRAVVYV